MSRAKYKLVCYGDGIAIPVPLWAHWITWDEDGSVWLSSKTPRRSMFGCWIADEGAIEKLFSEHMEVPPPEPGPWEGQKYWLR